MSYTSSNVKSMGDQINGLERTTVLYSHCISDPERSEMDGLNSNDTSMRGFTIDPENREALYFEEVDNVDSSQRYIMTKLETCYGSGRPSLINYKVDTGADGNLLPIHDLHKVKPDVELDSLAHTINPNVKL